MESHSREENRMAYAEDNENLSHASVVDGDAVAAQWEDSSKSITAIGQRVAQLQATGRGSFYNDMRTSLFKIGQSCTDIGLRLTTAAGHARDQAISDKVHNVTLAADTKALTEAKAAVKAYAQAKAAFPNNPDIASGATSAAAAESAARGKRFSGLAEWDSQAQFNTSPLKGHATEVDNAAQRAVSAQLQTGSGVTSPQTTPSPIQQVQVPSGGASNTTAPLKTEQPSKSNPKPEDNKGGDPSDKGTADPSKTGTPTAQQAAQNQQQGQPQQGGQQGGAPQGAQPAGAQPRGGLAGVPTPTPVGVPPRDNGKGGGVRTAPTLPPRATVPNGPLGTGRGAAGPLGVGGGATAANANATTRSGGAGSSGAGTGGAAQRAMGGMPMGAGHGGGAGGAGGSVRAKAEIKSNDPELTGARVEAESTGGVASEDETPPNIDLIGSGGVTNVPVQMRPAPPAPPSQGGAR